LVALCGVISNICTLSPSDMAFTMIE